MKSKWLLFAVAFAVLLACRAVLSRLNEINDVKARAIASWLRSQPLKQGKNSNIVLPGEFRGGAIDGRIYSAYVHNGKLAYFIQTTSEWKGNYDGYVYLDSDLPFTIGKDSYDRDVIEVAKDKAGQYAIYEVVDKKISKNLYRVLFDLN